MSGTESRIQKWTLNSMVNYSLTKQERISNGKKHSLFNKWFWENWSATCRRIKLDHFLTSYTKMNSKWMKDDVTQEPIEILEENIGSNLFDLSCSNSVLDTSPKARERKAKINYWDFIKIKSFAQQREQSTNPKDNQQNGKPYLQISFQIKG